MTEEVWLYGEAGGGTLVDPTLEHIGRDPEKLRRVSEATGVHIVMGTGFYREPYYPEFVNKWTTPAAQPVIERLGAAVEPLYVV